jgi:hypothetical protein
MATFKYFNGDIQLTNVMAIDNAKFDELGGVKSKHNRFDSFKRMAGKIGGALVPVTRMIEYKSRPSLHKCDARCQNSTGHVCECSCGGKYHGINA